MENIVYRIARKVRLYLNLIHFFCQLTRIVGRVHRDARIQERLLSNLSMLINKLNDENSLTKTTQDSLNIYQAYKNREIDEYFNASSLCLLNNQVTRLSFKDQRAHHLQYIYAEIDALLTKQDKVKLLEIGCGNCLNVYEILKKYGSRIEIVGMDISENRIGVAKEYFKDALANAVFHVGSITQPTPFDANSFDLVYSMFCLEQIAYDVKSAVAEMYRLARHKVVMLEPVFENGNILQRVYLIHADHTRILLKSILELKLPLVRNEVLAMQFNPSNQSTLLIVEKAQS